jgi:hypothetical protein
LLPTNSRAWSAYDVVAPVQGSPTVAVRRGPPNSTATDAAEKLFEAAKQGWIEQTTSMLEVSWLLHVRVKHTLKSLVVQITGPNVKDSGRGSSPLHYAAGYNRIGVVEALIALGVSVNVRDNHGLVPLHSASAFGHVEVMKLLLAHGAQVNCTDNYGFSPLHEASGKGRLEACQLLLRSGADRAAKNSEGKMAEDMAPAGSEVLT